MSDSQALAALAGLFINVALCAAMLHLHRRLTATESDVSTQASAVRTLKTEVGALQNARRVGKPPTKTPRRAADLG